jgi:hypothetical protein
VKPGVFLIIKAFELNRKIDVIVPFGKILMQLFPAYVVKDGMTSCFMTHFGITHVLSERIIASKMFNTVSMRGLFVHYA